MNTAPGLMLQKCYLSCHYSHVFLLIYCLLHVVQVYILVPIYLFYKTKLKNVHWETFLDKKTHHSSLKEQIFRRKKKEIADKVKIIEEKKYIFIEVKAVHLSRPSTVWVVPIGN